MINIEAGTAQKVFRELGRISNIAQVDVVTGPYDMIALVQGTDFHQIGNIVMNKIQKTKGISKSLTCNVIRLEA